MNFSVVENVKLGIIVGFVFVIDEDFGKNGEVWFFFLNGDDNNVFYIDLIFG